MPWWRKQKPPQNDAAARKASVREYAQAGRADQLAELLSDRDASVRREAVMALGRLKDARALGPLWEMLYDGEFSNRYDAAETIVGIPGINGTQLLAVLLQHHNPGPIRERALSQFIGRGSEAANILLKAMTNASGEDLVAVLEIAEIGALRNVSFENELKIHREVIFRHTQEKGSKPYRPPEERKFDGQIRIRAIRALAAIGDGRAAQHLIGVGADAVLSERIGSPMIPYLLDASTKNSSCGQFYVDLLSRLLKKYVSQLNVDELRRIIALGPVKQNRFSGDPRSDSYESWEVTVDCSGLKRVAEIELKRRLNSTS